MATTNLTIRIDEDLKERLKAITEDMGMDLTTLFTIYAKKVARTGTIPFLVSLLADIIKKLANGEKLPAKNKDHALTGNFAGKRECHITPDWLLIYEIYDNRLILFLSRTGTHSDLLDM